MGYNIEAVLAAKTDVPEPSLLDSVWGLAAGTVVSGVKDVVDSVRTIGATVGISSPYETRDTRSVIAEYSGKSAAEYYDRNPHLVEGAGLLVSTIVPGSAGIKVLRAAQGAKNSMLGSLLNLPVSTLQKARDDAKAAMAIGDTIYAGINANTAKALGAGLASNVLDMAAFETLAMTVTFASPVYSDFTAGDYAKSMLTNIAFGGAIGGAFSGAKTFYGISTAATVAAGKTAGLRVMPEVGAEGQKAHFKIVGLLGQLDDAERVLTAEKLGATKEAIAAQQGINKTIVQQQVGKEVLSLAPNDHIAANKLTALLLDPSSDAVSIIGRATRVERGVTMDASIPARIYDTASTPVKVYDAGVNPGTHLGDTLLPKHELFIHGDTVVVNAEGKISDFKTGGSFEALDELSAQAAWIKAGKETAYELEIAANDLPRLEKLMNATDESLMKQPANVGGKLLRSNKEVRNALLDEKVRQWAALETKMLPEQLATRLNVKQGFGEGATFENFIAHSGKELVEFISSPRYISVIHDIPTITKASEGFFAGSRKASNALAANISASSFLREAAGSVNEKAVASINSKLDAGISMPVPTLTVKADGSLAFDGRRRVTAVSKKLQNSTADTEHIPLHVTVEEGATIPATLPSGAPFPVIRNGEGLVVLNPAAQELPIRLTRAFAEESMRVTVANAEFSKLASNKAAALFADTTFMPDQQVALELLIRSTPAETGAGGIKSVEGVTGGVSAVVQLIGTQTHNLIAKVREEVAAALNPSMLVAKEEANFRTGSELIFIANRLRGTESHYCVVGESIIREDVAINRVRAADKAAAEAEKEALMLQRALTKEEIAAFKTRITEASRVMPAPTDGSIEVLEVSANALKLLQASTERNARNLEIGSQVTATIGTPNVTLAQQYGLNRLYLPPINTKANPHFVYVRQTEGITSTSHTSVITAPTAEALTDKVKLLQRDYPAMEFIGDPRAKTKYEFLYKQDLEEYHKAAGNYEYSRGMNENFIDSALHSKKMMWEPNPPVDKQLANAALDDLMDWHRRMADKSVRDTVELKYGQFFKQLELMGSGYTKAGTSTFTGGTVGAASFAAQTVKNPYGDMIKLALDIGKQLEYPTWMKANEFLNTGWAKASLSVKKAGLAMLETKNPRDLELEVKNLNEITNRLGFGNPYEVAMLEKSRNQLAANPSLTGHIAKANAGLNFLVLGSDMLQAFNTLIGTTVHATELAALRGKILKQDVMGAGKLAQIPASEMPSAIETVADAASSYWKGGKKWNVAKGVWEEQTGKELLDGMIRYGLRVGDAQQLRDMVDGVAYNPKLSAAEFGATVDTFMEGIRKYTGNTAADAISRFMAARSMQIHTDLALSKGILGSEAEAAIYINQHVTRVHGATIASQRPIMFSGPIGQSIGVFMTFYTNFLQRMFQHAGAGDASALMTMSAMQVGLYGLQGLPAFNFINTHLIGTASGNKSHADLYTSIGGSETARWIMYGAGSNMLGLVHPDLAVNLYSRGDLNPRQASIIPLPWNPEDTALFSATKKTVTNLAQLAQHLSGGAGIKDSLLFALEHNGVNRPISGIGAFLGGGQTTSKGTLLASYGDTDLASFAFFARLAGGKPLDDATAADGLYRLQAYKADRASRVASVGENLRLAMKNGEMPDVTGFMRDYTHAGGDLDNFNKFVKQQFVTANNSQINKAASDLGSPEAEGLSRLMGGEFRQDLQHPQEE